MSRDERKYVRFYYPEFVRDYRDVYEDDAAYAAWMRLLVLAEQVWPLTPELPRSVRSRPLRLLVERGLVVIKGHEFTIKGLDAERGRRHESARNAADARWSGAASSANGTAQRNADRTAEVMPKTSTRQDETRFAAREVDDNRPDLEAFLVVRRRPPTPKQRRLLDEVMDRHDLTGPEWAADLIYKHPDDPIGAVLEADKAWRAERIAAAQAQEAPKPKPRRSRGLPQTTREIMAEMKALDFERAAR